MNEVEKDEGEEHLSNKEVEGLDEYRSNYCQPHNLTYKCICIFNKQMREMTDLKNNLHNDKKRME